MKDKLTYKNIINKTLALFPEYQKTEYFENNDKTLPYSFISGFVNYVCGQIQKSDELDNSEQLKKYFDFFNMMFDSKDEELINLAVVEVLEMLVQQKESKLISELLLNENGNYWLLKVLEYTGV